MKQTRLHLKHPSALLEALARAEHQYENRLDMALTARGLSNAKFTLLHVLSEAGEPLPLGQLAERLTCVKSNITQLVDRLEADGLVRRLPDAEDRRSKRAAITEQGRRRYEVGLKVKLALEQNLLRNLSAEERGQLTSVLEKLSSAAKR